VDVHLEISSVYRANLGKDSVRKIVPLKVPAMSIRPILRRDKHVSFYLPDSAPYIFYKDDTLWDHWNKWNTVEKPHNVTTIIIL
jgi:hypothetical protein